MTLLIAILLIAAFEMPPWLYGLAIALWIGQVCAQVWFFTEICRH
jgi:hypothetical protein